MITVVDSPPRPPVARTPDGEPGRRIEWIGEASPFDDPFVAFGVATGRYTHGQIIVLRRAALRANKRTETNLRRMSPQDPGLSREIIWGPGPSNWVRVLSYRDADKLLSCNNGHEFRDLDAAESEEPLVLHPPMEIRLVGKEVLKRGQTVGYGQSILQGLGPR